MIPASGKLHHLKNIGHYDWTGVNTIEFVTEIFDELEQEIPNLEAQDENPDLHRRKQKVDDEVKVYAVAYEALSRAMLI